jgi:hypothetical protein
LKQYSLKYKFLDGPFTHTNCGVCVESDHQKCDLKYALIQLTQIHEDRQMAKSITLKNRVVTNKKSGWCVDHMALPQALNMKKVLMFVQAIPV